MVPEVEVAWFFEHVLPKLPKEIDLNAVVNHLKSKKVIKEGGWKAFPKDPKRDRRHEDVYAQLEDIFDSIVAAVNTLYPSVSQHFALLVRPTRPPDSERGSCTKPDSSFVPVDVARHLKKDPNGLYEWYDIAEVSEVKKAEEASIMVRNENVAKVVYSLQQIMSLNPCRRFTFGSTIQNRELRVWFACRGAVLTTKACDFFTSPDRLVHFFIAFAFSSPTALGWDPTIQYFDTHEGHRRYKITVDRQEFTTVSVLADYAADSTVSRGTRVWLVEDKRGERYVLKDLWLDEDRLPEHTIREELLKDVLKKCGQDDCDKLSRHILTPHVSEKVAVGGSVDTTVRMMDNQTPSTSSVFTLFIKLPANPITQSLHPRSSASPNVSLNSASRKSISTQPQVSTIRQSPSIRRKYHYRILFKEYGTNLYQEKSLLNVFTTLADLVNALDIIHRSGWVHRDISCGNVYCFHDSSEDRPRGILGDFEYAKRITDTQEHEQRIGTLEFMASEAKARKYLFRPPRGRKKRINASGPPNFTHNALHDLESCWWLLVYILLHNDDASHVNLDLDRVETRHELTNSLFTPKPDDFARFSLLKDEDAISLKTTGLEPSLECALSVASDIAGSLTEAFTIAEAPVTSFNTRAFFIHKDLCSTLTAVETLDAIRNIQLQEVGRSKPQGSGLKRKLRTCDQADEVQNRRSKRSRS
ncbi:hypothetical protein GYMLUDRAFT_194872 [Collybiopsis luxurians FD-317 M1]|nr:hypothetical protein GYMLUDRAFT_194872 [Collybiopsis luxurians FD-317 M1]